MTQPKRGKQHKAPPKRTPSSRRRSRKYAIHYFLLFVFCIGLGLTLCFTVFFKVDIIKIKNNTFYSNEEVIARSQIQKGDNLFQINTKDVEKMLQDRFHYFASVKVRRSLPTSVVIEVTEEEPIAAAYTGEGYAILSYSGKVLETRVKEPPENLMVVLGMEENNFNAGSYLYEKPEKEKKNKTPVLMERMEMLQQFYTVTSEKNLEPITYVDLTNASSITALYDERILISFGSELDLAKKVDFVNTVLERGIAQEHKSSGYTDANFQGTIDITSSKQLRTRAVAIDTIWDERAFEIFEGDTIEDLAKPEEGDGEANGEEEELQEEVPPQEAMEPQKE